MKKFIAEKSPETSPLNGEVNKVKFEGEKTVNGRIHKIIRNNKGMIFAIVLATLSALGGCRGCSCTEPGNKNYIGCDPAEKRLVCGTEKTN